MKIGMKILFSKNEGYEMAHWMPSILDEHRSKTIFWAKRGFYKQPEKKIKAHTKNQ